MVELRREIYPQRVRSIVNRCRGGQTLCKYFRTMRTTGETEVVWFLEPSGRRVGPVSAAEAVERGFFAPANDGLFDDAQTFRLVDGA